MYTVFVILNYISVFVLLGCTALVATHESSKMQKYALLVCMLLLVCSTGFLIKSEAKQLEALVIGQKLVYASVTHAMFIMILFILQYCKFRIPTFVKWICHSVNIFITVVVLTMDHHSLFYKKVWVEELPNGHYELMKEYGPMHTLVVAVFVLYMLAALEIAIEFTIRNIRSRSRYVWKLLIAVSLPCLAYIIPKVTSTNNELQPIAFSLFSVMLILMVYRSNLYDVNNITARYSVKSVNSALIVFDSGYSYKGCNNVARKLFPRLADITIDKNISKSEPFFKDCLDGKINEYTFEDKIYSISVRPVHSGASVSGRVLWFDDVTMERNYTRLLQREKHELENKVETLYDISHKDDMTGLFNRRGYEKAIEEIRQLKDISDIVIAEYDINELKAANDEIGHNAGDELIISTAEILSDVFSKYGNVYRTGGDEFFVIIKNKDADVEKLKNEISEKLSNWHGKLSDKLSLSGGFVRADENPGLSIDELMIAADREMYKDKADYYAHAGTKRR